MHLEISIATNFIISHLYNKLPRRRVDAYGEELSQGLNKKFECQWYAERSDRSFRLVRINGQNVDPAVITAIYNSGLDVDEVKNCLPEEFAIWIDPGEVTYQTADRDHGHLLQGPVKILFSQKHSPLASPSREVQDTSIAMKPFDNLSDSLSNLAVSTSGSSSVSPIGWPKSLPSADMSSPTGGWSQPLVPEITSPVNGWPKPLVPNVTSPSSWPQPLTPEVTSPSTASNPFLPRVRSTPTMTAAMFAQTKFGSTKMRTNAKRPTWLPPPNFNTIRPPQMTLSPTSSYSMVSRSRSLSPGDPLMLSPDFNHDPASNTGSNLQCSSPSTLIPGFSPEIWASSSMTSRGDMMSQPTQSRADNSQALLELASQQYPNAVHQLLLAS